MPDIWPMIHAERKALASDLASLSDEQWATPSLCQDWTVRDVLAHLTATAKINTAAFFPKLVSSGFSLTRMQNKGMAQESEGTSSDTLQRFVGQQTSTKHPPGPMDTWLGEMLVHAEDIRRPLGITHDYDAEMSARVARFYSGSNLIIGAKKRIEGLHLQASDASWSHGTGAEVSGPLTSLIMAMTGRKAALADLTGQGVTVLAARP